MKFNPDRPYGIVTGHSVAQYEQEGLLFDGGGELITVEKTPKRKLSLPVKDTETINDAQLASARAFLENILSGGPLDKSIVYKESENNNQRWETVKSAFAAMNGRTIQQGQSTLWAAAVY